MKIKETVKIDVRADLIAKGYIKPSVNKTEVVKCKCGDSFDRLLARTWDNTCGPCLTGASKRGGGKA